MIALPHPRRALAGLAALFGMLALAGVLAGSGNARPAAPHFAPAVYVDQTLGAPMSLMFHSTVSTFGSSDPAMGLGTSYVLSGRICSTAGSLAKLFNTPWPAVTLIVFMIQNGWYCAPAFFRNPRKPA